MNIKPIHYVVKVNCWPPTPNGTERDEETGQWPQDLTEDQEKEAHKALNEHCDKLITVAGKEPDSEETAYDGRLEFEFIYQSEEKASNIAKNINSLNFFDAEFESIYTEEDTKTIMRESYQLRYCKLPEFVKEWDKNPSNWEGTPGHIPLKRYVVWDEDMEIQGSRYSNCLESAWIGTHMEFFLVGNVKLYKNCTVKEKRIANKLARERGDIT